MARFRTYANGIDGHKYKGYYITRNNNNNFAKGKLYAVIDSQKNIIINPTPSYDDCEWEIDKMVADEPMMELFHRLYAMEIVELYRLSSKYSEKVEEGTITRDEKELYAIIQKILRRKVNEKSF